MRLIRDKYFLQDHWPMLALIGVGVLAFAALIVGPYVTRRVDHDAAVAHARRHLDTIDPDARGRHVVDCQELDSDHNGYISCTARLADGNVYAMECNGKTYLTSGGCRAVSVVGRHR